jgi:hypothetical protein
MDGFTFVCADDVRTSQETHLWASTACYMDGFTFLYVDDVRTSQETHLWSSTACYRDGFTFLYADDVCTFLYLYSTLIRKYRECFNLKSHFRRGPLDQTHMRYAVECDA